MRIARAHVRRMQIANAGVLSGKQPIIEMDMARAREHFEVNV